MKDAGLVRGVNRGGDLFEKRKRLRERQGTLIPADLREGPPFEELRDDVGTVTRRFVDSEIGDLDDVGVPEASEHHSLPAEALESDGGGRRSSGLQKLDREGLLQADMDRAVDDPDGSFAETLLQSVFLADEVTGGWRSADIRLLPASPMGDSIHYLPLLGSI